MTPRKRQFFTPEEYRRLARNPFVDPNMLKFVKNKTVGVQNGRSSSRIPPGSPTAGASSRVAAGTQVASRQSAASPGRPRISERTAQLIAMTIKAMMRE